MRQIPDVRQAQRIGSIDEWVQVDPILAAGEIGVEENTGKFKIGDGVLPWHLLSYYVDEEGVSTLIEDFMETFEGGTLDPRVGDLDDLSTTAKSTVVSAINDVNTTLVPLRSLYNNAKAG